jgi:hypothetical protein
VTCILYKKQAHFSHRPAVENQKIKRNEPMGYTPISYVIGKRNDGTLRIMILSNWISFLRKMHFSNESRKRKTNFSWPLTLIMQKRDHFRLLRHHYSESPGKSKHTRFAQHRYFFCKSVFCQSLNSYEHCTSHVNPCSFFY